jgi:serine/threonine protein kinase
MMREEGTCDYERSLKVWNYFPNKVLPPPFSLADESTKSSSDDTRDDLTEITWCETECSDSFNLSSSFRSSVSSGSRGDLSDQCSRQPENPSWTVATNDELCTELNNVDVKSLQTHCLLGEGYFGKVWLVSDGGSSRSFALKKIAKYDLVCEDKVHTVLREKQILQQLHHHGIVRLHAAYQDESHLCLLLPFLAGGELFTIWHAAPNSQLPEHQVKFYAACLVDALWYMHCQHGVVYRDLKPENIMMDATGYPVLVDFGYAKQLRRPDHDTSTSSKFGDNAVPKSYTLCGTGKYISPEMVLGAGHSFTADYWSLGVVLYELLSGENPFEFWPDMDEVSLYTSIAEAEYLDLPDGVVSTSGADLIDKLLRKDPRVRLGCAETADYNDVLRHEWFAFNDESQEGYRMDIAAIRGRSVSAPWLPCVSEPLDTSNFDTVECNDNFDDPHRRMTKAEQALFADF